MVWQLPTCLSMTSMCTMKVPISTLAGDSGRTNETPMSRLEPACCNHGHPQFCTSQKVLGVTTNSVRREGGEREGEQGGDGYLARGPVHASLPRSEVQLALSGRFAGDEEQ